MVIYPTIEATALSLFYTKKVTRLNWKTYGPISLLSQVCIQVAYENISELTETR